MDVEQFLMKCFAYDEDKIVLWDSGASLSFIDEGFRNRLEGKLETVKDSSIYKVCLGDGTTVETQLEGACRRTYINSILLPPVQVQLTTSPCTFYHQY